MVKVAAHHGSKLNTVQMPLNVLGSPGNSFTSLVVPELVKQKIGILGMEGLANEILLRSNTVTPIECLD